nr:hypothetical protein 19 [bacterium]
MRVLVDENKRLKEALQEERALRQLADTLHMTLEEQGAYTRLLFIMWRSGASRAAKSSGLTTIINTNARGRPATGRHP